MATSRIVWCFGILIGPKQIEYPDVHMGINGTLSKKKNNKTMKIRCLVCSTLYLIPTSANLSLISKRFHSALYIIIFSYILSSFSLLLLETLHKSPRRQQQECGKTKDLMGRTIAQHVRVKLLYISFPSSAKQQRDIAKKFA